MVVIFVNIDNFILILLFKIVGLGLMSVFELVRDTRQKYPELCVRALTALLDMLQGQQPESMKSEPPDVIGIYVIVLHVVVQPLVYKIVTLVPQA